MRRAAGHGLALWSASGGAIDVSRSGDGGATWSAEAQPPGVPDRVEVALDGADNTSDETGLVYWDHGQSAPVPRQLLPIVPGASNATPVAVLDPSRAATVAYQQNGQLVQVSTADALATQFGAPTPISGSAQVGGAVGAQAPDGRAAIAWYESKNIPANQYASTVRFDLHAAVRGPGGSFAGPQLVDGSDDVIAGYSAYNGIAVAPDGRAILGYRTMRNRGTSLPCPGPGRSAVRAGAAEAPDRARAGEHRAAERRRHAHRHDPAERPGRGDLRALRPGLRADGPGAHG